MAFFGAKFRGPAIQTACPNEAVQLLFSFSCRPFVAVRQSVPYDVVLGPNAFLCSPLIQGYTITPPSGISPKKANPMEQRKHDRVQVEYVGSFSGERISTQGVILDLSSAGCRARSRGTVKKGNRMSMVIDVPRYLAPLHVDLGVVRWSHGGAFGMEFIQVQRNDHQRLRELIRAIGAARALRENTETP